MRKFGFLIAALVVASTAGATLAGPVSADVDKAVVKCAKASADYGAFKKCIKDEAATSKSDPYDEGDSAYPDDPEYPPDSEYPDDPVEPDDRDDRV